MIARFARLTLIALGGLTLAGAGTYLIQPSLVIAAAGRLTTVTVSGVACDASMAPPMPPGALIGADGQVDVQSVRAFLSTLQDADFLSERSCDWTGLKDLRRKDAGMEGRVLPIRGVCNYSQDDMFTGQIVGRLFLRNKGAAAWKFAEGVELPAGSEVFVLVDFRTPERGWRMHLVSRSGAVLFTDMHMVYKSTFRHKDYPNEVWSPDVGYHCLKAGKWACLANPWDITPKELAVDNSSQIWVACTKTGCCCSGSGCH